MKIKTFYVLINSENSYFYHSDYYTTIKYSKDISDTIKFSSKEEALYWAKDNSVDEPFKIEKYYICDNDY